MTTPTRRSTLPYVAMAIFLLIASLPARAVDWSTVPVADFVTQANQAVITTAQQDPDKLAEELAAILNAGAAMEGISDADLVAIIAAAFGCDGVDAVALVKATYPLIKLAHRARVADAMAAAAPANQKAAIMKAIAIINAPRVPALNTVVTQTSVTAVSKE